jgi:hypothetical protein
MFIVYSYTSGDGQLDRKILCDYYIKLIDLLRIVFDLIVLLYTNQTHVCCVRVQEPI